MFFISIVLLGAIGTGLWWRQKQQKKQVVPTGTAPTAWSVAVAHSQNMMSKFLSQQG